MVDLPSFWFLSREGDKRLWVRNQLEDSLYKKESETREISQDTSELGEAYVGSSGIFKDIVQMSPKPEQWGGPQQVRREVL